MSIIQSIEVCVAKVPLDKVTYLANRTVADRHYGLVKVRSKDGAEGIGFCYVGNAAGEIFREFGSHLGEALMIIMLAVDPEAIILGGSISQAFPFFEKTMREKMKSFPYPHAVEKLMIETSEEPDIAILGAAALFLNARVDVDDEGNRDN